MYLYYKVRNIMWNEELEAIYSGTLTTLGAEVEALKKNREKDKRKERKIEGKTERKKRERKTLKWKKEGCCSFRKS